MSSWSLRFSSPMSKAFRDFTMSICFDRRLALVEIVCNLAYCSVLHASGFINSAIFSAVIINLLRLFIVIRQGHIFWLKYYEDIHLNVEFFLSRILPGLGDYLRTARSRNDLSSTDLRIWLRSKLVFIFKQLKGLIYNYLKLSVIYIDYIMPSFTHLQVAQPVLLSHYLLCYVSMFFRDLLRLRHSYLFINSMPLGCGAVAGTSFNIDRFLLMQKLQFFDVIRNSIDAVSDRDYVLDFCYSISVFMMHVSRFCEEVIIWSNKLIGFVVLSDGFSSGSSMMPQKKNPDGFELLRAKASSVISNLFCFFMILKSLPLAYNKDYQEDKLVVFTVADIATSSLSLLSDMVLSLTFNRSRMYYASGCDFSVATDLAEFLTRNGMPYKAAHALVSSLVSSFYYCGDFKAIPVRELLRFSTNKYLLRFITTYSLNSVVNSKVSLGGTARRNVIFEIKYWFVKLLQLKL